MGVVLPATPAISLIKIGPFAVCAFGMIAKHVPDPVENSTRQSVVDKFDVPVDVIMREVAKYPLMTAAVVMPAGVSA